MAQTLAVTLTLIRLSTPDNRRVVLRIELPLNPRPTIEAALIVADTHTTAALQVLNDAIGLTVDFGQAWLIAVGNDLLPLLIPPYSTLSVFEPDLHSYTSRLIDSGFATALVAAIHPHVDQRVSILCDRRFVTLY